MKKYFVVSLIERGVLGGGMTLDEHAMTYHTGKVTVAPELRRLVMKYEDILNVHTGRVFLLPTLLVELRSGKSRQFLVFFGRKRLLDLLAKAGVSVR